MITKIRPASFLSFIENNIFSKIKGTYTSWLVLYWFAGWCGHNFIGSIEEPFGNCCLEHLLEISSNQFVRTLSRDERIRLCCIRKYGLMVRIPSLLMAKGLPPFATLTVKITIIIFRTIFTILYLTLSFTKYM